MNKQNPTYLRLVSETSLPPRESLSEDRAALERACSAFVQATGWQMDFAAEAADGAPTNLMWSAPVETGVGASPGHIRLFSSDCSAEPLPLEVATPLAESIGELWGELLATREALWQREAELATGVPLVVRDDDPRTPALCERIEAVLKGGAEALGCQAAALYLLDAATTELKLRSSWGLPRRRLLEPARPLRPALADLEALLGHAVVMTEPSMFDYWKVPEPDFRSAVCVPVSSPSMPLGTLWIFSDRVREFNDSETNIAEVVAGRLAAELERETLVEEAVSSRGESKEAEVAQRWQQEHLPAAPPVLAGWDVAGRVLGGSDAFYDWCEGSERRVSLLAVDAGRSGIEGALTTNLLRGAFRAVSSGRHSPAELAEISNAVLWCGGPGDARAGLFHAHVGPRGKVLEFCSAGPVRVLSIVGDSFQALQGPTAALGLQESVRLASQHHPTTPEELILVYGTSPTGEEADEAVLAAFDQRLALSLEPHRQRRATELIDIAAGVLAPYCREVETGTVLLLIKRRKS